MTQTPPPCDRDGCERESEYLLAGHGDRCREHAIEDDSDTVAFLDHATGGHA